MEGGREEDKLWDFLKLLFTMFLMDVSDWVRENSFHIETENIIVPQNLWATIAFPWPVPSKSPCGACQNQYQLHELPSTPRAFNSQEDSMPHVYAKTVWFLWE